MHTAVLVHLDEEIGEEPGGAHDDERRVRGFLPEQRCQLLQRFLLQIMRDDKRETPHPLPPILTLQHLLQIPRISNPLDALIQLAQQRHGLLRAVLAHAIMPVEEEVVACVGGCGERGVEDGEVADAGEDEVLEDGGAGGGGGGEQDAGGFEGCLA